MLLIAESVDDRVSRRGRLVPWRWQRVGEGFLCGAERTFSSSGGEGEAEHL